MPEANQFEPNFALVVFGLGILAWILQAQVRLLFSLVRREPLWPDSLPSPVPWKSTGVFAVLVTWIVLQIGISQLMVTPGEIPGARAQLLATGALNLMLLAIGPTILARVSRVKRDELHLLGPEPGPNFWRGVAVWPVAAFWIYLAFILAQRAWPASKHPVEEMLRADHSAPTMFLASVTAILLAPAAEEFLFRGVLLGWMTRVVLKAQRSPQQEAATGIEETTMAVGEMPLTKPYVGLWIANITTSIVFAMMHATVWPSPIPIFLLSLALGVLYQKTGGIAAPLGLHTTFNGISTLFLNLTLLSGGAPANGAPQPPEAAFQVIPAMVARAVPEKCLSVAGFVLP